MRARREYLDDLLNDCLAAVNSTSAAEGDSLSADARATLVAALVLSDSLNGVRKALLQHHRPVMPPHLSGLPQID